MTKEEMQKLINKEMIERGNPELETLRYLMDIIGITIPKQSDQKTE